MANTRKVVHKAMTKGTEENTPPVNKGDNFIIDDNGMSKAECEKEEIYELKEFLDLDSVKIGHARYDVSFVSPESPKLFYDGYNGYNLYGIHKLIDREIVVRNTDSYDEQLDTFIHEILHGLDYMYYLDLGEESVTRLATAFATFLIDNDLVILQENLVDREEIEKKREEETDVEEGKE